MIKIIASLSITLLTFSSCSSYRKYYQRPISSYSDYNIRHYTIREPLLTSVERPEDASKRYGKTKVVNIVSNNDTENNGYMSNFSDELIKINFVVFSNKLELELENVSSHTIIIPWDKAAIVDSDSQSLRISIGNISFQTKNLPQKPSVIPKKGKLKEMVVATDKLKYYENLSNPVVIGSFIDLYQDHDSENQAKAYAEKYSSIDSDFRLLLPIEVKGVLLDYIFTFKTNKIKPITLKTDNLDNISYKKELLHDLQIHADTAKKAMVDKKYDEAIDNLSSALDLVPEDSNYWYMRGEAYIGANQCEKAALDFKKACQLGHEESCNKECS